MLIVFSCKGCRFKGFFDFDPWGLDEWCTFVFKYDIGIQEVNG